MAASDRTVSRVELLSDIAYRRPPGCFDYLYCGVAVTILAYDRCLTRQSVDDHFQVIVNSRVIDQWISESRPLSSGSSRIGLGMRGACSLRV